MEAIKLLLDNKADISAIDSVSDYIAASRLLYVCS